MPKEHCKGSVFYLNGNISNDLCFELRKIYWTIFAKRFYTYLNIKNCTFLSWFEDHKLVLLRFRESLFALNQIDSLSVSKFNISKRQFGALCDMNTLVSSANSIRINRLEALNVR